MIHLGRFTFFWWTWRLWLEGIAGLTAPPIGILRIPPHEGGVRWVYVRLGPLEVRFRL